MDLHLSSTPATADERAAVDGVLGPAARPGTHVGRGGHAARARRDLLLPVLHAVQERVGWISRGAIDYVGARLTVPPAEAFGVASFYGLFSTTSRPPVVVHVCDDLACAMTGGALDLPDDAVTVPSPCLGQCDRAPAALIQRAGAEVPHLTVVTAGTPAVDDVAPSSTAQPLLRRIGVVDPASLEEYRREGGYEALAAACAMGRDKVVTEVTEAKLLGRGGAAFPTGAKWAAVAGQPERPHYVVANADESEPGTFKDRILMEGDPFALVEAMTIAGFATGSERGYLYVRGEYPVAATRVLHAIETARGVGLLGDDVMGAGFGFDIEVRRGAGAYICGEETALFNSIEGYRGEPRNKPPFPVERGLFGKPTAVNNVETLMNVPLIMLDGGRAFASSGTPESTGTRLFCLSGKVERPGLYEVEFGATLGEVLALAGGVAGGRTLQAVLLGGAAGAFVGPDELDLPLTFEATRAAGVSLGSGVVMALDDTVVVTEMLGRIARFFRDESCGQCVPCRVGTVRQQEALERRRFDLIDDLARVMGDASICGLGHTASAAIQSAMRLGLVDA